MSNTDAIELALMLSVDSPPEDDQLILYGIHWSPYGGGVLHGSRCCMETAEARYGAAKLVEPQATRSGNLKQFLKERGIDRACSGCYEEQLALVSGLLRSVQCNKNLTETQRVELDCYLLLNFEAWYNGNSAAWAQWLFETTPGDLREKARQTLGWTDEEPRVAVFEADGRYEKGWAAGLGDHVTVPRSTNRNEVGRQGLVVHGLAPTKLAEPGGAAISPVIVPVDSGFTKAHLEVAVNLYEHSIRSGWDERQEDAENAVKAAKLVLA